MLVINRHFCRLAGAAYKGPRMVQTSVAKRQIDVAKLNQEAKRLGFDGPISLGTDTDLSLEQTNESRLPRLRQLNSCWEGLKRSVRGKQLQLEDAIREAQKFYSQLDELRRDCHVLEGHIPASGTRVMGGLPDSAKQKLGQFMKAYNAIENLGNQVDDLRCSSAGLLASAEPSGTRKRLSTQLDRLGNRQVELHTQAKEWRSTLEAGLVHVDNFHSALGQFIQWLTQMERRVAQFPPVSLILCRLEEQIPEHSTVRRELTGQRDTLLSLDRSAVYIQTHAQELDVALVKNLLSSTHARWEKLLMRSTERSRALASAYKEAQKLLKNWQELTGWLNEQLNILDDENWVPSTNTELLLRELTRHREFQRELGIRSAAFDSTRRQLQKTYDRSPVDDHAELEEMQSELKHLWNAVCAKSLQKQKTLEELLLRSGQYKDALGSLCEWMTKLEAHFREEEEGGCGGDVESVKQLEEAHNSLVQQLNDRKDSITKLQTAAAQLLSKTRPSASADDRTDLTESFVMQEQLAGLNALWDRVQLMARARTERLAGARKDAEKFQKACQDVFDYCTAAEYALRKLALLPEGDDPRDKVAAAGSLGPEDGLAQACQSLKAVANGLAGQESRVCDCLALGNRILTECGPEAATRVKQWMHAVNSRWEELLDWTQKRESKLSQATADQHERRRMLDSLINWLDNADRRLRSCTARGETQPDDALSQSDVSSESSIPMDVQSMGLDMEQDHIRRLLNEHALFEAEMAMRKSDRDVILHYARKRAEGPLLRKPKSVGATSKPQSLRGHSVGRGGSVGRSSFGSKRQQLQEEPPKVIYANEKVNEMNAKWDHIAAASNARRQALEERLAHALEVERLKGFDFDIWRKRYLQWLNEKKARLIDLFHRYDLDRDGKLSHKEFVDAILNSNRVRHRRDQFPTSRLELELVANIVDAKGDGFIDMQKFNAALRNGAPAGAAKVDLTKAERSAIEHETSHQVSLCTCHNTYRICKISGNMYRFGDSQKLRLVRFLHSNVMVRVGGGWVPLTEYLAKNDPCRVLFYTENEVERGRLCSFWKGTEEDRQDAGFPDDVDHMMLAFHPKTSRSGSSCASGCSRPFTLRYRTNSSGCAVHQLASGPLPTSSRSSLDSQHQLPTFKSVNRHRASLPEDRQVTFRQITMAMNAPAEALRSSMESSDSVHSLPPVHLARASDSLSSSCKAETVLSREECQPLTDLSDSLSLSHSQESRNVPQSQPFVPIDAGDDERRPSVVSETDTINSSLGGETVVHDTELSSEVDVVRDEGVQQTLQSGGTGSETAHRDSISLSEDPAHAQKGWPDIDATGEMIDKNGNLLDETSPPDSLNSLRLSESKPNAVVSAAVDQDASEAENGSSLNTTSKPAFTSTPSSEECDEEPEILADETSLHTVVGLSPVEGEEEQLSEKVTQSGLPWADTDVLETADGSASNLHLTDSEHIFLHETTSQVVGEEEHTHKKAEQKSVESLVGERAGSEIRRESLSERATISIEEGEGQEAVGHVIEENEAKLSVRSQQLTASSTEQEDTPERYSPEKVLQSLQSGSSSEPKLAQESLRGKYALSEEYDDRSEKGEADEEPSECPESVPADAVSADGVFRNEEQLTDDLCGLHSNFTKDAEMEEVTLDANCKLGESEFTTTQARADEKIPVTSGSPKMYEQNMAEITGTLDHQETMAMDSIARVLVPEIRVEDYSKMPLALTHPLSCNMASTPELSEKEEEQGSTLLKDSTDLAQSERAETETF
ncbi:hypothetical protein AAHC03_013394 [Spirometra sp. Aus1]